MEHLESIKQKRPNENNQSDTPTPEDDERPKRAFELNLAKSYWMKRFLYPFALDPAPLRLDEDAKQSPEEVIAEKKRQKLMSDESIMQTSKFQFPIAQMKKEKEYHEEVALPIKVTFEEIKQDMSYFARWFPTEEIPHIMQNGEINDIIHNYRRPKASDKVVKAPTVVGD